MNHFTLINQLARERSSWGQFIWGVGVSAVLILFQILLRKWLVSTPFVLLPMAIVIASFFGGGQIAGLTATFILTLYSFTFPTSHSWISQLIFFVTGILGSFFVDIFQKKIQELTGIEVRSQEAERLKFAAAAAKLGIWEWDIQKDILSWDDQMLVFYGITREAFTGQSDSWQKGLHPDDIKHAKEVLEKALKGEGNYALEFRVIHPDGAIRNIIANALIIRDKNGTPSRMFGLNRDITEEKLNLQKTEELRAYFEAALVQSPAGIVIAEAPTGLLRFANPAALQIAGRSESVLVKDVEISQYHRWQITELDGTPIPNEELPLAKAARLGQSSSSKVVFVRPNGEKRVVYAQTAPIRRKDGSIMSGITVYLDITEQQRLIEDLKTAQKVAEAAMRSKAKFLDIAAHELRTPVTAASLLAQLTHRQLEKGEVLDKTVLHRMRVQIERLSRLVVDLLEVSKLDRGVLELRHELTDLRSLISDCCSTFNIQFPDRKINFNPPEKPVELMIDPIRICEVVSNLIDNAIKYSPEGSPLNLDLKVGPDSVRFSVRDYGPGLTEDAQKKLFSAFERGNAKERASGLGLGLFICRGIIDLHGGSTGVRSTLGAGSTFYFDLPRKPQSKKLAS